MRTARPPPLQNPKRGPHGGLRVHRRLVQPPSPPFRPRLSFTDQLRKDSANRKSNRKPNTVHRNGVAPVGQVPGAGERVLQNTLVTISTAVARQVSVPSVLGIALR